jgi:hypothetical protein
MICVRSSGHKQYAVIIDFSGDGNGLYHFILQIGDSGFQSGWVITGNVREILKVCPGKMEMRPGERLDQAAIIVGRKDQLIFNC